MNKLICSVLIIALFYGLSLFCNEPTSSLNRKEKRQELHDQLKRVEEHHRRNTTSPTSPEVCSWFCAIKTGKCPLPENLLCRQTVEEGRSQAYSCAFQILKRSALDWQDNDEEELRTVMLEYVRMGLWLQEHYNQVYIPISEKIKRKKR